MTGNNLNECAVLSKENSKNKNCNKGWLHNYPIHSCNGILHNR